MRVLLPGVLLLCGLVVPAFGQSASPAPTLPATDVTAVDMMRFIDAMPKDAITDAPLRAVDVGGHRVGIYGVFRPKTQPGDAIAHETRTTEVYYILQGAGVQIRRAHV